MKKFAFTLSEVLLTLAIVGVVSTMTVPSLVNSIDERELEAQAKKAQNTIQSAINLRYATTGKTPASVQGSGFTAYIAPALNWSYKSSRTMKLSDGQLFAINPSSYWCNASGGCVIMVDINGDSGPTMSIIDDFDYSAPTSKGGSSFAREHRDIVYFAIQNLSVLPYTPHGVTNQYFADK